MRGRDVHAWVEVRLDDGSWFPLRASTFVPSRDKTPSEQQLKSEEQKVGAQVPPPAGVNPPSLLQGPDQAQNATDIAKRKKSPFDVGAWPWWLKVLVLGVLLPLLLVAGYLLLVRWLKARRRLRHASTGPVPARAAWVWRDLVAEARSLGVPRAPPSHPPRAGRRRRRGPARCRGHPGCRGSAACRIRVAVTPASASVASPRARRRRRLRCRARATRMPCSPCTRDAESVLADLRAGASRWVRWRSDADPRPLLARTERRDPQRQAWWRRWRVPGIRRRGDADPTPA